MRVRWYETIDSGYIMLSIIFWVILEIVYVLLKSVFMTICASRFLLCEPELTMLRSLSSSLDSSQSNYIGVLLADSTFINYAVWESVERTKRPLAMSAFRPDYRIIPPALWHLLTSSRNLQ